MLRSVLAANVRYWRGRRKVSQETLAVTLVSESSQRYCDAGHTQQVARD
jgi:hypothetical protein